MTRNWSDTCGRSYCIEWTLMNVSGHLFHLSPLSTLGALCIGAASADESCDLFNKLLAWELRKTLIRWSESKGQDWLIQYRQAKNVRSVDGLPGLTVTTPGIVDPD